MPSTGPGQQFGQGVQQNAQNQFNNIANVPLQGQVTGMQQPQQPGGGDKFAPGNIFAAMKKSEFGKPEEQQPQNSGMFRQSGIELPLHLPRLVRHVIALPVRNGIWESSMHS